MDQKKVGILLIILIVLIAGCVKQPVVSEHPKDVQNIEATQEAVAENQPVAISGVDNELKTELDAGYKTFPAKLNLNVDFVSQSPFADWGLPYQEACEEAAMIMSAHYFLGKALNKEIMDQEIKDLVEWEKKNLGLYTDTALIEMKRIIEDYFNLKAEIEDLTSIVEIKQYLNNNQLVLIPTFGRELFNSNYKEPGPIYHMLLIRGYDQKGNLIANDPGTRNGREYKYKFETVYNAGHDLPVNDDGTIFRPFEENVDDHAKVKMMKIGRKQYLVISGK